MTASFQCSRRDGPVRGLVLRQGRLVCALVIAAWINVIVSAQAGAEGLWRCSFRKSDGIWQCAFSPPYHPPRLGSCHPFIPLNQQCLLWVPTHLTFLHCSPPRGPKDPSVCHRYQPLSLSQETVWCGSKVNFSSETGCCVWTLPRLPGCSWGGKSLCTDCK